MTSNRYGWLPNNGNDKDREIIPKRDCIVCGKSFRGVAPKQVRCRSCIRRKMCPVCKKTRKIRLAGYAHCKCTKKVMMKNQPTGYYIYGWTSEDGGLPFYIGKGIGQRAWRECEFKRQVVIYRDNLTEEGAYLVEAVLISFLRRSGVKLLNVSEGVQRQEKLPLTMDEEERLVNTVTT